MKRTFILSLCLCAVSAIFAQRHDTVVIITKAEAPVEKAAAANDNAVAACCDQDFNQKTYANDPEEGYYFTKWELGVKGGLNYLNCAPTYPTLSRADVISWNAALDLVYNFNDLWGLKGGVGCYAMGRTGLEGYAINIDLAARLNITNLVAPHRSELSRRFNVYGNLGMGYAPIILKGESENQLGHYGVGLASLEAEARISRLVGLFLDGEFRAYFTSPKQAVLEPNPYRPCLAANVGIRFHF